MNAKGVQWEFSRAAAAATTTTTTTTAGNTPADATHTGRRDGPRARRVQVAEHGRVPPAEGPAWHRGEGAAWDGGAGATPHGRRHWHAWRESQDRGECGAARCCEPVREPQGERERDGDRVPVPAVQGPCDLPGDGVPQPET